MSRKIIASNKTFLSGKNSDSSMVYWDVTSDQYKDYGPNNEYHPKFSGSFKISNLDLYFNINPKSELDNLSFTLQKIEILKEELTKYENELLKIKNQHNNIKTIYINSRPIETDADYISYEYILEKAGYRPNQIVSVVCHKRFGPDIVISSDERINVIDKMRIEAKITDKT